MKLFFTFMCLYFTKTIVIDSYFNKKNIMFNFFKNLKNKSVDNNFNYLDFLKNNIKNNSVLRNIILYKYKINDTIFDNTNLTVEQAHDNELVKKALKNIQFKNPNWEFYLILCGKNYIQGINYDINIIYCNNLNIILSNLNEKVKRDVNYIINYSYLYFENNQLNFKEINQDALQLPYIFSYFAYINFPSLAHLNELNNQKIDFNYFKFKFYKYILNNKNKKFIQLNNNIDNGKNRIEYLNEDFPDIEIVQELVSIDNYNLDSAEIFKNFYLLYINSIMYLLEKLFIDNTKNIVLSNDLINIYKYSVKINGKQSNIEYIDSKFYLNLFYNYDKTDTNLYKENLRKFNSLFFEQRNLQKQYWIRYHQINTFKRKLGINYNQIIKNLMDTNKPQIQNILYHKLMINLNNNEIINLKYYWELFLNEKIEFKNIKSNIKLDFNSYIVISNLLFEYLLKNINSSFTEVFKSMIINKFKKFQQMVHNIIVNPSMSLFMVFKEVISISHVFETIPLFILFGDLYLYLKQEVSFNLDYYKLNLFNDFKNFIEFKGLLNINTDKLKVEFLKKYYKLSNNYEILGELNEFLGNKI